MISRTKADCPPILAQNAEVWRLELLEDPTSDTKRKRYRHADIKAVVRDETSNKCIYCESKVGHNTPGDIEHILPSSKVPEGRFDWENLTLACTECNRRKSNYYEVDCMFLNPYNETVEDLVIHAGPFVSWVTGNTRAEVTIRKLALNTSERFQLICQKIEKLTAVDNLLERIASETNPVLAAALEIELRDMQANSAEFSQMVRSYVLKNEQRTA